MEQVVFSVKDGSLLITGDIISLNENSALVATNNKLLAASLNNMVYLLPQSLIRTPKSDEELSEEYAKGFIDDDGTTSVDFLAGRKSFGDKPIIDFSTWYSGMDREKVVKAYERYLLETPPIYPHTITVQKDGDNYLWENLKCEY